MFRSSTILLSAPAVKEHITKLEDKGIIEKYTININYKKIEKILTAFILFETVNCQAFREFLYGPSPRAGKLSAHGHLQLFSQSHRRGHGRAGTIH